MIRLNPSNYIPSESDRARMLAHPAFQTTIPKLERVTDRYRFIPSTEFIRDVESFGYRLIQTAAPRKGLGTHSMTFVHPDIPHADGLSMRLLATNSHDATSAFRLYIEVLVQVCSNGAVAWRPENTERVVHTGYALDKVQTALENVQTRFAQTLDVIQRLKDTFAAPENTAAFLNAASTLRDAKPYRIMDLQTVRHAPQAENTAWNVFNRVQESLIRGGYRTVESIPTASGTPILVPGRKARELTAIKDRVQVNRDAWRLAVESFLTK